MIEYYVPNINHNSTKIDIKNLQLNIQNMTDTIHLVFIQISSYLKASFHRKPCDVSYFSILLTELILTNAIKTVADWINYHQNELMLIYTNQIL